MCIMLHCGVFALPLLLLKDNIVFSGFCFATCGIVSDIRTLNVLSLSVIKY